MDLWIRSQDKTKLKKTNYLQVEFDSWQNKSAIICNTDVVAVYETKERAMKVLDEIQKLLMSQDIMVFHNIGFDCDKLDALHKKIQETKWVGLCDSNLDSKVEYISPNSVVFEMPKE